MTGKDILQEEFERAGIRGYKAEGVDAFLASIATFVDKQEDEKNELLYKIKILAEKVEEYKADEENIREALLGAQKLGTSILNEAKAKSEAMLHEARSTYETTVSQAKSKAEAAAKEVTQRANMELNELRRESEKERILFEKMKKEISTFRASIYKQYKNHLDMLASLPVPSTSADAETKATATETTQEGGRIPTVSAEEIKPIFEASIPRVQFFDQDAEPVSKREIDFSEDKQQSEGGLFFTKSQTIVSGLSQANKELEKEEAGQTKEFASEASSSDEKDVEAEKSTEAGSPPISGSQEFKVNIGSSSGSQRPNYMEKFGELKFGGFSPSDKSK